MLCALLFSFLYSVTVTSLVFATPTGLENYNADQNIHDFANINADVNYNNPDQNIQDFAITNAADVNNNLDQNIQDFAINNAADVQNNLDQNIQYFAITNAADVSNNNLDQNIHDLANLNAENVNINNPDQNIQDFAITYAADVNNNNPYQNLQDFANLNAEHTMNNNPETDNAVNVNGNNPEPQINIPQFANINAAPVNDAYRRHNCNPYLIIPEHLKNVANIPNNANIYTNSSRGILQYPYINAAGINSKNLEAYIQQYPNIDRIYRKLYQEQYNRNKNLKTPSVFNTNNNIDRQKVRQVIKEVPMPYNFDSEIANNIIPKIQHRINNDKMKQALSEYTIKRRRTHINIPFFYNYTNFYEYSHINNPEHLLRIPINNTNLNTTPNITESNKTETITDTEGFYINKKLMEMLRKQSDRMKDLILDLKEDAENTKFIGRNAILDFDNLLHEVAEKRDYLIENKVEVKDLNKRITIETTKKQSTTIRTVDMMIDETEIRKALKENVLVQRVLKLAAKKRKQYLDSLKTTTERKVIERQRTATTLKVKVKMQNLRRSAQAQVKLARPNAMSLQALQVIKRRTTPKHVSSKKIH